MRLTVAVAVCLLFGCDNLLFVEVDVPNLCQQMANQPFEAAPTEAEFTVDREFEYPLSLESQLTDGVVAQAQIKTLSLTPGSETEKLDFIRQAQVEMRGPEGSELPAVKLVAYQRTEATGGDGPIVLRGDNIEIMPYINSGKLMMKVELTGMLPTKTWSANVQTCVAAKVRYPYWKAVEGLQ